MGNRLSAVRCIAYPRKPHIFAFAPNAWDGPWMKTLGDQLFLMIEGICATG